VDATRSVDLLGTFDAVLKDGTTVPFTRRYRPEVFPAPSLHGSVLPWHHTGATVSSNAVRAAGVTSMTTLVAVKVCGISTTPLQLDSQRRDLRRGQRRRRDQHEFGGAFTKRATGGSWDCSKQDVQLRPQQGR